MKNKFRVCLVGLGVISDNHIVPLTQMGNIEIVGLCDIDVNKALEKNRKHGLNCAVYTSYTEMLDTEKPDAVHILTPHHLHTDMTCEALKRNINVVLEKPICIKKTDIEKIISEEEKSNARVTVCYQNRFKDIVRYAKQVAEHDGGINSASAGVIWNRPNSYYSSADWRGKWDTEGGGVMINQAIHTLDLLCFFIGIPKKVQAITSKLRHNDTVEVEDSCECIVEFDNGAAANIYATTNHLGSDSTFIRFETKHHIIEIKDTILLIDGEIVLREQNDNYIGKQSYGTAHGTLIKEFYNSLASGTDISIPLSNARYSLDIILSAYESHGKIIDI